MTAYGRVPRWTVCLTLVATMMVALWGCAAVPRRYTWIAEPGVTLTMLSTNPRPYVGKVVLLGGTILEEEEHDHDPDAPSEESSPGPGLQASPSRRLGKS